jgi:DNA-binding IclR family transcriptional regulator
VNIETHGATASTVDKAIDVLEVLRDESAPVGLREIARRVGISPASTHRLLTSLRVRGLVAQADGSRAYTLGWGLLDYANAILQRIDLASVAAPIARTLRDATGETVTVQVPVGRDRVCVFELEGTQEGRRRVGVGRRIPLHAGASGRAILAFMPDREIERVLDVAASLAITHETETDRRRIGDLLDAARVNGVAFSSGETVDGVSSMASPVFDAAGAVVGSIAVSGPSSRWTPETMKVHVPVLRAAARELSSLLGFRGRESGTRTASGGSR